MEDCNLFSIITKRGRYPLCDNDDKIVLFTPQQVATAFSTNLSDIRSKLVPKATVFSKIKDKNDTIKQEELTDNTIKQEDKKQIKELNQSKDTKFIILDITDNNNISIVTDKKTIFNHSPRTMKFGLHQDAENYVKKLNKRDATGKYCIIYYRQEKDNLPY